MTSRYVNEARGLLGLHGAVVSHLPRSTSSSPAGDVEEDESLQLWQLNLDPVQPNLKHKPARVPHHHVILTSARDRNRVALPRVFRVIFFLTSCWYSLIMQSCEMMRVCACVHVTTVITRTKTKTYKSVANFQSTYFNTSLRREIKYKT